MKITIESTTQIVELNGFAGNSTSSNPLNLTAMLFHHLKKHYKQMKRELQLFGKDLPDAVRLEYEAVMKQLSALQSNVLEYEERTPDDILKIPELKKGAVVYIDFFGKPVEASIIKVYSNFNKIPGQYGYAVSWNRETIKMPERTLKYRMEDAQKLLRHEA